MLVSDGEEDMCIEDIDASWSCKNTNLVVDHLVPWWSILGCVRDLAGESGNASEDVICGVSSLTARDSHVAQVCDLILKSCGPCQLVCLCSIPSSW